MPESSVFHFRTKKEHVEINIYNALVVILYYELITSQYHKQITEICTIPSLIKLYSNLSNASQIIEKSSYDMLNVYKNERIAKINASLLVLNLYK